MDSDKPRDFRGVLARGIPTLFLLKKYVSKHLLSHPFALLLSFIPLACALFFLSSKAEKLKETENLLEAKKQLCLALKAKEQKNAEVLSHLKEQPYTRFAKEAEAVSFLNTELKQLESLLKRHKETPALLQRITFLKSGKNRLNFVEQKREKKPLFQELSLRLKTPVEVDGDDLKKVLSLVEQPSILVEKFTLEKKQTSLGEEVWSLDMHILKKESL